MVFPPATHNSTALAKMEVMFSNLIGSGAMLFRGGDYVQCVCANVDVKPNLDFGFFEEDGMLYIKSFELKFQLEVHDRSFRG